MTTRPLLRDLALLAFAATLGWWAHSASAVHADTAPHNDAGLGFQFGGTGIDGSLTVYSPADHTLYVYPAKSGSSNINCAYSLHIGRPGEAVERTNCPVGSLTR